MFATRWVDVIKEKILKLAKENNGIVTSKNIKDSAIPTIYLTRLEKEGKLHKVEKGI